MKSFLLALSAFCLLAGATAAPAAVACRDKNGKFIKCPAKPAKPKLCRDARGHYAKCK